MDPGHVCTGLGLHIIRGLGVCWLTAAVCCWLPWIKSSENAIQSIIYCATDAGLTEQTGLFYSDCSVQITPDKAADMEDAYRLYEMSERMVGLTS